MDIIAPLFGGLGLFLFGMTTMGNGLQKTAGNKLKKIVEMLTKNRLTAVIVGFVVTALLQSSSATTVLVVGFVNAGIMTLQQAIGVILGANLGTTITSVIIALRIDHIAPLFVATGVFMMLFVKNKKIKDVAETLVGFGILFIGMTMMSSGLKPLAAQPWFADAMLKLNNPVLGLIVGMALTTLVQSSSAATGLIQTLALSGAIGLNQAFPLLFGGNIGTTTTALISSIAANRTARRAALVHFFFNFFGTLIFMVGLRYPLQNWILSVEPDPVAQIAMAHIVFNGINIIIALPFTKYLEKLVYYILPGEDAAKESYAIYLDDRLIKTTSIAAQIGEKELMRMADVAYESLLIARDAVIDGDFSRFAQLESNEDLLDGLEQEISEFIIKVVDNDASDDDNLAMFRMINISNDLERIGDHVINIEELINALQEKNLDFTPKAKQELAAMFDLSKEILTKALEAYRDKDLNKAAEVELLEDKVDKMEEKLRKAHIKRLRKAECAPESGIIYLDMISNLERIADHSNNISGALKENEL